MYRAKAGEQAAKVLERWKSEADQRLEAARQAWAADADERRKEEGESSKTGYRKLRVLEAARRNWKAAAEEEIKKERARWGTGCRTAPGSAPATGVEAAEVRRRARQGRRRKLQSRHRIPPGGRTPKLGKQRPRKK